MARLAAFSFRKCGRGLGVLRDVFTVLAVVAVWFVLVVIFTPISRPWIDAPVMFSVAGVQMVVS